MIEHSHDPADRPLRVGLVHNWPGARNSEFDLILRMGAVLRALGHHVVIMDPVGAALDELGERVPEAPPTNVDLQLNLHYLNPKYLPALSYVVNWNPLDYLVNDPITRRSLPIKQVNFTVDCLRTHDRVLSADSEVLDEYARLARGGLVRPWIADAELLLHTTIESQAAEQRAASCAADLRVFYIGINWEKLSADPAKQVRHAGLFEALDPSGRFEFYGLREQAGVPLWEGIKSYQGELPFDGGRSIVDKCRDCGAALVLSSDQHRASAVVSTRIFQAAAAGAIIIADRNPFVEDHFGDSVLYFDYGETGAQTAQNILRCLEWVDANWLEARAKADAARRVFEDRFALEAQLSRACEQAQADLDARARYADALGSNRVRVIYRASRFDTQRLSRFVRNLARQTHDNFAVTIVAPQSALHLFEPPLQQAGWVEADLRATEDYPALGAVLAALVGGSDEFAVVYSDGFEWREDHLFCLLSAAVEHDAALSYSPLFREDPGLKSGLDMMAFFIHGMDGGLQDITRAMINRFEMHRVPLGNILLRCSAARRLESDYGFLRQFDIGSVYALMYLSSLRTGSLPAPVFAVTSQYVAEGAGQANWAYDAYGAHDMLVAEARQRDRNAFCAFFRHIPEARAATDFTELLASWEYEQLEPNIAPHAKTLGSHAELLREVARLRGKARVGLGEALVKYVYRWRPDLKHWLQRNPPLHRVALAVRRLLRGRRIT